MLCCACIVDCNLSYASMCLGQHEAVTTVDGNALCHAHCKLYMKQKAERQKQNQLEMQRAIEAINQV